jgi:hypothetical protein
MRAVLPEALERGREREGTFASDPSWGPYGRFIVRVPATGTTVMIIASGDFEGMGDGWEHV